MLPCPSVHTLLPRVVIVLSPETARFLLQAYNTVLPVRPGTIDCGLIHFIGLLRYAPVPPTTCNAAAPVGSASSYSSMKLASSATRTSAATRCGCFSTSCVQRRLLAGGCESGVVLTREHLFPAMLIMVSPMVLVQHFVDLRQWTIHIVFS